MSVESAKQVEEMLARQRAAVSKMVERKRALVASLVGSSIVSAEFSGVARFREEGDTCRLTLGDGRTIEFVAFGYDAWGLTVDEVSP